jgi:hypothetical protein
MLYDWIYSSCTVPITTEVVSSNPAYGIQLRRGVLNTTLCDKVCQWLATGLWFSPVQYLHLNWPPQYNWNIVESGIKHPNPNPESCIYKLSIDFKLPFTWK